MSTNPTKPEPSAEEKVIAKQLASWRKEIARLQDLVNATEPSAQDEMRASFESKYGPKDSFAWRNEDGSYKVTSLQIAWELWQNAAQWQATRQAAVDPCPNCPVGAVCKKPTCGRLNQQDAPSDLQAKIAPTRLAYGLDHTTVDIESLNAAAAAELVAGAAPVPEDTVDAQRYRFLCRKVAIAGGKFHILNLTPTYCASRADIELDSVIDAQILAEKEAK